MTKILIIDDETDIAELFRQSFRREIKAGQFDFVFASRAEEALQLLAAKEPPDFVLVFSDINMPGMSGLDLLEVLRIKYPALPVSVISAYSDDIHKGKAKERGARDYFVKPIDFDRIRLALNHFMESV